MSSQDEAEWSPYFTSGDVNKADINGEQRFPCYLAGTGELNTETYKMKEEAI